MNNKLVFLALMAAAVIPAGNCRGELSEIKVEKMTVSFTPQLQFTIPNGIIDVFLKEEVYRFRTVFASKYDFIDDYIDANLDVRYSFPVVFLGTGLSDKIDFEERYSNKDFLQRTRYIMPYLGFTVIKNLELKSSVKFENTSTVSIDDLLILDRGRNIVEIYGAAYNTLDEAKALPKGEKISLEFSHSLDRFKSEYDYTQADLVMSKYLYFFSDDYLFVKLKGGYPVYTAKKPLTSIYYMGGYDNMHGFEYKEFRGDSQEYAKLSYHMPLVKMLKQENIKTSLEIITADLYWESGKIGDKKIFDKTDDIKSSYGLGMSCVLTLFRRVNTKFMVFVNQAVEPRNPTFHFIFTAFSYIYDTQEAKK